MRTESTRKPEPVEIRKLGVINGVPVVYLYLNSDVKQETRVNIDNDKTIIYSYDSTQITVPVPTTILPEIDTALIALHSYNQTTIKQKATTYLPEIKTQLKESTTENTFKVDRRDKLNTPKQVDLDNLKNLVLATKKTTPTTN